MILKSGFLPFMCCTTCCAIWSSSFWFSGLSSSLTSVCGTSTSPCIITRVCDCSAGGGGLGVGDGGGGEGLGDGEGDGLGGIGIGGGGGEFRIVLSIVLHTLVRFSTTDRIFLSKTTALSESLSLS